ncbi:hypothetical protein Bca52824_091128, partial [Brassica carinata]
LVLAFENKMVLFCRGYMAPEYISKGILSNKIDAYSFGVLVLEITSGFRNNKFRSDNSLETLVTQ